MNWFFGFLAPASALALISPAQLEAETGAPLAAARTIDITAHIAEASQRFGLPQTWIVAVIRVESAGRTRAVSSAGAMGLMQLMPATWSRQRARFSLGVDPFDPRDNIIAGTSYLREMYDLYGEKGFLAAYNAGPGRYEQWLSGRRALPAETRRYVARVTRMLRSGYTLGGAQEQPRSMLGAGADVAVEPAQSSSPNTAQNNPFGAQARHAHDLFAVVSTASNQ